MLVGRHDEMADGVAWEKLFQNIMIIVCDIVQFGVLLCLDHPQAP
jgi:hypothetical protein